MTPCARNYARFAAMLPALTMLAVSLLGALRPTAAQSEGAQPVDNPYSVNVFLHKEVEQWKIDKTLQMIAEANIPWIKQEFPWQEIEFEKGYFHDDKWDKSAWEKFDRIVDTADKYGLKIIARVGHPPAWARADDGSGPLKDNQDLADFTTALLDHYDGRIQHVQIWNEPNLAAEWVPGQAVEPAGYADMLKTVYPAVKQEHSDAVILSAPLAITLEGTSLRGNMNELEYWAGLYDNDIKDNFDIASANAYGLDQPPDAPPGERVLNFRRVELLRAIMEDNDDEDKPVWLNEYAWNASPESLPEEEKNYWRHVTEETQAEWTVQGIEYARQNWPWAGVISIWYFRQVGDIPPEKAEYYFRMVNPDFTTTPLYDAVKDDAAKYPGPAQGVSGTPTVGEPTPTTAAAGPTATTPAAEPTSTTAPAVSPTAPAAATPTIKAGPTPTPESGPVAGDSGGNVLLYVLGGALVVAGLAGLGYYFMRGRGTNTSDPSNT